MRDPIPIRPSLEDSWFTTEPQLHTFADEDDVELEDDTPADGPVPA